jgi:hypothetical protein
MMLFLAVLPCRSTVIGVLATGIVWANYKATLIYSKLKVNMDLDHPFPILI